MKTSRIMSRIVCGKYQTSYNVENVQKGMNQYFLEGTSKQKEKIKNYFKNFVGEKISFENLEEILAEKTTKKEVKGMFDAFAGGYNI